jgi:hypothetical protein
MSGIDRVGDFDRAMPVTVRHLPGYDLPPGTAERAEAITNTPLQVFAPGELPPAEPRPAPPAPTEAELRERLGELIELRKVADADLTSAEAAHQRASQHLADCRNAHAGFENLDSSIASYVASALRDGRDDPLPADLRLKRERRMQAWDALEAAQRAYAQLDGELAQARGEAAQAARAARKMALSIMAHEAVAVAERYGSLEALQGRLVELLVSFDRVSTPSGILPPGAVLDVLRSDLRGRDARRVDPAPWQTVLDKLLADPDASVAVAPPDLEPPLDSSGAVSWPPDVQWPPTQAQPLPEEAVPG